MNSYKSKSHVTNILVFYFSFFNLTNKQQTSIMNQHLPDSPISYEQLDTLAKACGNGEYLFCANSGKPIMIPVRSENCDHYFERDVYLDLIMNCEGERPVCKLCKAPLSSKFIDLIEGDAQECFTSNPVIQPSVSKNIIEIKEDSQVHQNPPKLPKPQNPPKLPKPQNPPKPPKPQNPPRSPESQEYCFSPPTSPFSPPQTPPTEESSISDLQRQLKEAYAMIEQLKKQKKRKKQELPEQNMISKFVGRILIDRETVQSKKKEILSDLLLLTDEFIKKINEKYPYYVKYIKEYVESEKVKRKEQSERKKQHNAKKRKTA
jgi:hypothetical protein